jgi:hypothetical protein
MTCGAGSRVRNLVIFADRQNAKAHQIDMPMTSILGAGASVERVARRDESSMLTALQAPALAAFP